MSWQKDLEEFRKECLMFPIAGRDQAARVEPLMKQKYPGNYRITEYYDFALQRFNLRVDFDDPKEKMIWMLKWN